MKKAVGAAVRCDLLILFVMLEIKPESKDRSLVSLDSSYRDRRAGQWES
ncbi:hypothetical protein EMIT0215P_210071 [Pseudomonas serboccidentalis]